MATTEELLAQLEAEAQSETPVCVIDPETRTITVPPEYQLLGVENDKRVERIPFRCPKIVGDNKDLSQDFILFMNYVNANGDPDAYHIDDMEVDGDNITFSWLLEENVTKYRGDIQFAFGAIIPGDEAEDPDKNRWNTTINTDCTCLVGLKCTQQVAESNPDALAQIWDAIDELKAGGGGSGTPGKDGREIELQKSSTAIQWRYVGDESWTDLVQLSEITGEKGDPGTTPTIGENGNWYLGDEDTGKPSRGERGPAGQDGAQGPAGQTGATPNIQIGTVQTLDPGQQATASMTGTPENPLLNLGIPKGADADPGSGGSYTLPIMSDTQLGGGKAVSKTDEDVPVAVDAETGQLFVPTYPSGEQSIGSDWRLIKNITLQEEVKTVEIDSGDSLNELDLKEIYVIMNVSSDESNNKKASFYINNKPVIGNLQCIGSNGYWQWSEFYAKINPASRIESKFISSEHRSTTPGAFYQSIFYESAKIYTSNISNSIDGSIKSIKIACSEPGILFKSGCNFKIYGR